MYIIIIIIASVARALVADYLFIASFYRCFCIGRLYAISLAIYFYGTYFFAGEFMPAEKVHPKLFDGCQKKFAVPKAAAVAAARHNSAKTKEQQKQRQSKQRRKSKKTLQKLAELGIQYSLEENQQTEVS